VLIGGVACPHNPEGGGGGEAVTGNAALKRPTRPRPDRCRLSARPGALSSLCVGADSSAPRLFSARPSSRAALPPPSRCRSARQTIVLAPRGLQGSEPVVRARRCRHGGVRRGCAAWRALLEACGARRSARHYVCCRASEGGAMHAEWRRLGPVPALVFHLLRWRADHARVSGPMEGALVESELVQGSMAGRSWRRW